MIWTFYPGCTGKVRYGHFETAERAVTAMASKGSVGLESYNCEFCDGFHIGHKFSSDNSMLGNKPHEPVNIPAWSGRENPKRQRGGKVVLVITAELA